MNPDTGRLHEVARDLEGVERVIRRRTPEETVEEALKRATRNQEKAEADSEPLPGTRVPDWWPRFSVGDEVGPVAGWWMEVVGVDVVAQTITLKPSRPTKARARGKPERRARRRGGRRR